MIKLKIRKLEGGKEIEKIIDFDGDYDGKFITQSDDEISVSWIPILLFDGWEPVEKII